MHVKVTTAAAAMHSALPGCFIYARSALHWSVLEPGTEAGPCRQGTMIGMCLCAHCVHSLPLSPPCHPTPKAHDGRALLDGTSFALGFLGRRGCRPHPHPVSQQGCISVLQEIRGSHFYFSSDSQHWELRRQKNKGLLMCKTEEGNNQSCVLPVSVRWSPVKYSSPRLESVQ